MGLTTGNFTPVDRATFMPTPYNAANSALGRVDPGGRSAAPAAEAQSVGGS
jgi:hypothetical protein